jgi:hypothetical protein
MMWPGVLVGLLHVHWAKTEDIFPDVVQYTEEMLTIPRPLTEFSFLLL